MRLTNRSLIASQHKHKNCSPCNTFKCSLYYQNVGFDDSQYIFSLFLEKPDCACTVSGDPHYRTFDGQMIHLMGICKYTLAKSTEDAPHFFTVEVKNEHRGNKRVSYTRMVDVKVSNVIIRLLPGHKMQVSHNVVCFFWWGLI